MSTNKGIGSQMGPRHMVKILTVDTETRKIEAMLKDAGLIRIAVFDTPNLFVWPKVNETWIVRQDTGMWMLDRRVDVRDDQKIGTLQPGEAKINADVIKTLSGKSVIAVDDSSVKTNQVVKYIGGKWTVGDPPTGSTITAGSVTVGSPLSITNSGTSTEAIFDFVIPEGPTGATGPANSLSILSTSTGDPGTDAIVTVGGVAPTQNLSFTIPRGDVGNTGPSAWDTAVAWSTGQPYVSTAPASVVTNGGNVYVCLVDHTSGTFATDLSGGKWLLVVSKGDVGNTGAAATATAGTTTTGAAGSSAAVINGGTTADAVFNFTIPRGDTGATGGLGALVTSLPGSPVDKEEIFYQNTAMAADGIVWHLKYNSGSSSSYKWEFVGGAPLTQTNAGTSTSITGSFALYTGVSVPTVPLSGDYIYTLNAGIQGTSTNAGTSVGGTIGVTYNTKLTSAILITPSTGSVTFTVTNPDAVISGTSLAIVSSGGTEWFDVTAKGAGPTYTITATRATQGTTAKAHAINDPVYSIPGASATYAGITTLGAVYAAATVATSSSKEFKFTQLYAGATPYIYSRMFSASDSGAFYSPLISIRPIRVG